MFKKGSDFVSLVRDGRERDARELLHQEAPRRPEVVHGSDGDREGGKARVSIHSNLKPNRESIPMKMCRRCKRTLIRNRTYVAIKYAK